MTLQELDRGFKDLVVRLYSDDFTNWRRNNFVRQLRKRHRQQREISLAS
jgi:hypothetical protein